MADVVYTGPEPDLAALLAARPALSMNAREGLSFESVPLNAVADKYGTPVWVYGAGSMQARFNALRAAFGAENLPVHIHYAVKANDHLAILSLFHRLGAGADVVSIGEFLRARRAGIEAANVVYSGVGKSAAELETALGQGIGQINMESAEELDMLSGIASRLGVTAPVVLRMNPDVDAGTHAKITTGLAENKFGIAAADIPALYARAATLPGIKPRGIALHIGSQILSTEPYAKAYAKTADMVRTLRGQGLSVELVDLGGGLGIGYHDEPGLNLAAFAATVRRELGDLGVQAAAGARALPGGSGRAAAGLGDSAEAHRKALRRAGRGDERADAPGFVRGVAWYPAGGPGLVPRPGHPGRCRRADLRERGLLRPGPRPARPAPRHPRRAAGYRRLWRGDEQRLQRPPPRGLGAGFRRADDADHAPAEA